MADIELAVWCQNHKTFEMLMIRFQLAKMVEGEWQPREGVRYVRLPLLEDKSTSKLLDNEGNETNLHSGWLPGIFYNIKLLDLPRSGGRKSMARMFRHRASDDTKYKQVKGGKKVHLLERTRMKDVIEADGGKQIKTKGHGVDLKAPRRLVVIDK